jgi:hypothetical protein
MTDNQKNEKYILVKLSHEGISNDFSYTYTSWEIITPDQLDQLQTTNAIIPTIVCEKINGDDLKEDIYFSERFNKLTQHIIKDQQVIATIAPYIHLETKLAWYLAELEANKLRAESESIILQSEKAANKRKADVLNYTTKD